MNFSLFALLLLPWTSLSVQPVSQEVAAGSESDAIQLFSSLDRPVASVGEAIIMNVEMLGSPRTPSEEQYLRRVFSEMKPNLPDEDVEMVRTYAPSEHLERLDLSLAVGPEMSLAVLHLKKGFVLRPESDGLLEIPGMTVRFRGREFSTALHELHVYQLEGDFLRSQRAVLPLVVESRVGEVPVRRFLGTGSAFLVAEDALVTAYHVVVNAHRITATLPNGRRVNIKKVWSIDPKRDVAVLYIDPEEVQRAGIEPLAITPRDPIIPGKRLLETDRIVFTTGWPDGMQQGGAGVLFTTNQFYDDDAIWLSSNRVRPGDSGGPLLDRRGRVIGVVSYGMSSGSGASQMLENVATSTDPRPALTERLVARRPSGLGTFRNDDFFERDPQARAVRVMSLLTEYAHLRRRSDPEILGLFLEELDTAVEQSYEVTRLHFLQGSIYQMLGDFDRAGDAYQRALVQRNEHYPAAYSLAYCRLAERSYEVAADLFDFTTHFEPYRDLAEYGLAQAKMQLLKYDEAIYHLGRIIHQNDEFAPAIYLLGRAYIGKGNMAAGARILVKLQKMNPAWGELLDRSIRLPPFRPVTKRAVGRARIHRID